MKGRMKVWIFQLVAIWVWSVTIAQHAMANDMADTDAHPEPKIEMYTSVESRLANNVSGTSALSIVGLNGLCLEAKRFVPKLVDCDAGLIDQRWQFYDDQTIRTEKDHSMCLTSNDLSRGSDILILPCSLTSSAYKGWKYVRSDNTILSISSNFVMDLRESKTEIPQQIILFIYRGDANQKWYLHV